MFIPTGRSDRALLSLLLSTLNCTFEEEGHEGDDGRFQFGDGESVGSVVSRWILAEKLYTFNF